MSDQKPTLPDADLTPPKEFSGPPRQAQPPKIRPADPRDQKVHEAGLELQGYLAGWASKYDLTVYEYLHVLSVAQFRQIQGLCLEERRALEARAERMKVQAGKPSPPNAVPPAPQPLIDPAQSEAPPG